MKKTFYLAVLAILLTGCGKIDERKIIRELDNNIPRSNVELTFKERAFEGTFSKDDNITLTLTSENLDFPVEISFKDNSTSFSFEEVNINSCNDNTIAKLINDAFKNLKEGEFSKSAGKIKLSNPPYVAEFNKDTLKLESLSFPSGKLDFLSKIAEAA